MKNMIKLQTIRKDFPILKTKHNGQTLVYLDSAATSLTPNQVVSKMNEYYEKYKANIHRGIYKLSEKATLEYERAREKVRKFINAKKTEEIIFTRNATESINLVAYTWGRQNLKKGDNILLSIMEHHSNIVPWQILQKEKEFKIHYLGLTKDGRLDIAEYEKTLKNKKIKLVSITHQSNVLGTINPVKKMTELAHKYGANILIDGAQAVPHMEVDVQKIGADFYVFSGHKICGPIGIGILYGKKELLGIMPPFLGGGDMINTVTTKGSTWADLPNKFEAGTPNIAGAIGLGEAIDYVEKIGMEKIRKQEEELLDYSLDKLKQEKGIRIYGPSTKNDRGAIITFTLDGVHPHDIAEILAEQNICIRAGHHCAQPLMNYLGLNASARISFYFYNTKEDIDKFVEVIKNIKKKFKL